MEWVSWRSPETALLTALTSLQNEISNPRVYQERKRRRKREREREREEENRNTNCSERCSSSFFVSISKKETPARQLQKHTMKSSSNFKRLNSILISMIENNFFYIVLKRTRTRFAIHFSKMKRISSTQRNRFICFQVSHSHFMNEKNFHYNSEPFWSLLWPVLQWAYSDSITTLNSSRTNLQTHDSKRRESRCVRQLFNRLYSTPGMNKTFLRLWIVLVWGFGIEAFKPRF